MSTSVQSSSQGQVSDATRELMTTPQDSIEQLRMFVLDVLRHDDIEQLSSVVKMLNNRECIGWSDHWSNDFTEEEVIPILEALARTDCVRIYREHEAHDDLVRVDPSAADINEHREDLWFSLTDKGRQQWDEWEPPS